MSEKIVDGVLEKRKDISKIIYNINNKIEVNTEEEMIKYVLTLIKSGININTISVLKDGRIYIDEFGKTIQEKIKTEYF